MGNASMPCADLHEQKKIGVLSSLSALSFFQENIQKSGFKIRDYLYLVRGAKNG